MIGRRIVFKNLRTARNRWESKLHSRRGEVQLCMVDFYWRDRRKRRIAGNGRCPWVTRIARPECRELHEREPGPLHCVPVIKAWRVSWSRHYYQNSFHRRRLGRAPASVAGHRLRAWRYPDIGF